MNLFDIALQAGIHKIYTSELEKLHKNPCLKQVPDSIRTKLEKLQAQQEELFLTTCKEWPEGKGKILEDFLKFLQKEGHIKVNPESSVTVFISATSKLFEHFSKNPLEKM